MAKVQYFGSMEAEGRQSPYTRVKGVLTPIKGPMKAAPKMPVKKVAPKVAPKKATKKFNPAMYAKTQKKVFGM